MPNETTTFIGDYPNNRYGMLVTAKKSSGMSRKCRACERLFAGLRDAQEHSCLLEREWRVRTRHYLPENAKPIRGRSRTMIRVERKVERRRGLVQRLLSMVGLG